MQLRGPRLALSVVLLTLMGAAVPSSLAFVTGPPPLRGRSAAAAPSSRTTRRRPTPMMIDLGGLFGFGGKPLTDEEVRAKYNVQLPRYDVVSDGDGYQLRSYQALQLVECDYVQRDEGYRRLSSYTGGANALGLPMPGTSPCLMRPCAEPRKTMAYVLPHPHTPYNDETAPVDAPAPTSDAPRVVVWPALRVATIPFGGNAVPDVVFGQRDKLKKLLARDGVATVDNVDEELILAQYNELFSLPWNRDNEVWLPLL